MGNGRPEPPEGHIGTPEAARILGRSQETIRNRLKAGTLKGQSVLEANGPRYYANREAVMREAREKNLPATKGDTGEVIKSLVERFDGQAAQIKPYLERLASAVEDNTTALREKERADAARHREIVAKLEGRRGFWGRLFFGD